MTDHTQTPAALAHSWAAQWQSAADAYETAKRFDLPPCEGVARTQFLTDFLACLEKTSIHFAFKQEVERRRESWKRELDGLILAGETIDCGPWPLVLFGG